MLNVELMIMTLSFEQEQARRQHLEEDRIWRELGTQRSWTWSSATRRMPAVRKPYFSVRRAWFTQVQALLRRQREPRMAPASRALMEICGER